MAAAGGRSRLPRRRVDGVLLLDKPAGLSSNAALQRAKHLFARREGGPHGDARPAGDGPPAALLRRCDEVRAGAARRAEGVCRDGALRRGDDHGRRRGRNRAHVRRGVLACRARIGIDALRRPDRADPAGVRGAQVPRPQLLRVRARRHRHSARPRDRRDRRHRARSIGRRRSAVLRVACGKGTYIRVLAEDIAAALSLAARTSRRCGAPSPVRFRSRAQ